MKAIWRAQPRYSGGDAGRRRNLLRNPACIIALPWHFLRHQISCPLQERPNRSWPLAVPFTSYRDVVSNIENQKIGVSIDHNCLIPHDLYLNAMHSIVEQV